MRFVKWITREFVKVEKEAEFIFDPRDKVLSEAKTLVAIPFTAFFGRAIHPDHHLDFFEGPSNAHIRRHLPPNN